MSVLVNKLDTTAEEELGGSSEFDIETLDDVKPQSGGASNNTTGNTAGNNIDPTLSVPLTSNSNNTPKPAENNNTPKPAENNNLNKLPVANNQNNTDKMPSQNTGNNINKTESGPLNNNTTETSGTMNNNMANPAPKTKKAGKGKKVGLTKKKRAPLDAGNSASSAINNDVQPQVELGSDRGTMTIKYASSKTMVPLFSTDKSNHLDLTTLRDAFQSSYKTVTAMSSDDLTKLRHDMLNTEFNEVGADSIITGLLYLLDDCDTKKLTLRMMLAKGELKIGA